MATQVEEWKIDAWAGNVHHIAQQMTSKLDGTTMVDSAAPSKRIGFDRIGEMVGERGRPTRFAATPNVSSVETRRWANPRPWRFGKLIDNTDKLETLHMADNEYAKAGGADMNRFKDELIIGWWTGTNPSAFTAMNGGLLGTADEGEETLSTVAFDTTNQMIAHGSANATKAKLLQLLELIENSNYDPALHGPLHMAYAPNAITALLADVTFTSSEHTGLEGLRRREPVQGLLGFDRWIPSTKLPKVGDIRRMVAWAEAGVGLAIWEDERARFSEREDLSYTPQIYMERTMGAVRVDDKLVWAFEIDETA